MTADLADDQLVELFQQLRSIDQRTWVAQAAICWEAKQRSVYGDRAWEAMGKSFSGSAGARPTTSPAFGKPSSSRGRASFAFECKIHRWRR